jgi:N-acetylated-alpha-linked acidic dipeptidase
MSKKIALLLAALLLAPSMVLSDGENEERPIIGFSPIASKKQREFESLASSLVKPENCREILHRLASEPNVAGTPGDRRNAEYIRDFLRNLGLETEIFEYQVYMSHAKRVELVINGERPEVIKPGERGVAEDPQSGNAGDMPPYIGYSPAAEAAGKVIYANYGLEDDFEALAEMGIDVKGAIILARYGRAYRGNKIYEAQHRGAAAMILFSDPAEDGYTRGDPYPVGPMRPGDAPQRGSVNFMFKQPGDTLTPLEPALPETKRIKPEEADIPTIPAIPLGYDDALKILQRLGGPEVPQGWQGGLPLRYHVGPGPIDVKLVVEMDNGIRPIWDVIGVLPGTEEPDQWVLIGCHRDAWVYGAMDPHSGNAAMLEAVRAIVEAAQELGGPRRSIVVCSWDAEEFGMVGSVEWVEHFRDELREKAVVYFNTDSMITGPTFGASCTPTLRPMMHQVIDDCDYPDGSSLLQHWRERLGTSESGEPREPSFGLFGGGSDHTGFLHHVGVPCAGSGFGGRQGVYHSAYDTIRWVEKFGDPDYSCHAAGARLLAVQLTRLANAQVLPFSPSEYAVELRSYLSELEKLDVKAGKRGRERLMDLVTQIEGMGSAFDQEIGLFLRSGDLSGKQELLRSINGPLLRLERAFIDEDGIPRRPWYRHLLYAPDLSNGYGMLVLPGLRENLGDEQIFEAQLEKLAAAVARYRDTVALLLSAALRDRLH